MKNKTQYIIISLMISIFILASCAAPASEAPAPEEPLVEVMEGMVQDDSSNDSSQSIEAEPIVSKAGSGNDLMIATRSNRLIIKDAVIKLLVQDSDIAVDLVTQIVSDVGGYIVSSRLWYENWGEESYKYSTTTIGVPVDQFERTLRRLRDISVRVLDENASGEDVTDQFVDLESQLENLNATRDRVRVFLDQAKTVEEALTVNKELSKIEGEIEEIQGRINYLADRAAYSTITISIEPELPELPTPTPHATSTAVPWVPSETFGKATRTLTTTYQGLVDFGIWIFVAVIPVIGPPLIVAWFIWRFANKEKMAKNKKEDE